jgi:hypothetical protein
MITPRPHDQRGEADFGWLQAKHSFSFSSYYDRQWMGFGALRVINEDQVAPSAGFAPHGHDNMEIITYVLSGSLKHQDSTGGSGVLRHGEIQVMSAGKGIRHSEVNASAKDPLHLLQIWIEPNIRGISPSYQQLPLDTDQLKTGFQVIVAPRGKNEGAPFEMAQNAHLLIGWPDAGQAWQHTLDPSRRYYLHVATGAVTVNDRPLVAGDALMFTEESQLDLHSQGAELLLFDLP